MKTESCISEKGKYKGGSAIYNCLQQMTNQTKSNRLITILIVYKTQSCIMSAEWQCATKIFENRCVFEWQPPNGAIAVLE